MSVLTYMKWSIPVLVVTCLVGGLVFGPAFLWGAAIGTANMTFAGMVILRNADPATPSRSKEPE